MTDIEARRLENLKQKQKLLADLNLHSHVHPKVKLDDETRRPTKKRKLDIQNAPSRTSARIAQVGSRPSYREDSGEKYNYIEREYRPKPSRAKAQKAQTDLDSDLRNLVPAADSEDIRAGWTKWTATAPPPTRDDEGRFHFTDYPTFTPNKSPEEVIREGCFGGSYFRPLKSRKLGILVQDDWNELPSNWSDGLDVDKFLTSPTYNADVNKFKVSCGQSIEEWEANGWINFEHDIRGWFQWYCRFFLGRRCDDDERQVSRWRKCVGETGRWRRMLLKKYLAKRVTEVFDDGEEEEGQEVSPVMHQTCHHWAYEVRQGDLDAAWRNGGK